jgi:O-methyltransferase
MRKVFTRPAVMACLNRGISFNSDGLISFHGADFLSDERFVTAYNCGIARYGSDPHVEWRVRVAVWAAAQGMKLTGDFVECGVNTGILTSAILEYISWKESYAGRKFYLLDTFAGIPTETLDTQDLIAANRLNQNYSDVFDIVRTHFSRYPNVFLVRGTVPDTLPQVPSHAIAYLSLDMNIANAEIAAGEYFWPSLVPGALMLLDDYNYVGYERQRYAWNDFAAQRGIDILPLPTGQGLIIK